MQKVLFELQENIAIIKLNRPEKMNALCIDMVEALDKIADECNANDQLKAVFVYGNDKAFSAGGDLKEMQTLSEAEAEKRSGYVQSTFVKLGQIAVPVIAVIEAIAYGGGMELALQCDIRVASSNAKFALPEVKYGMIPGAGGTVMLPEVLPQGEAAWYLLTGEEIPSSLLLQRGVLQKVLEPGTLLEEAQKLKAYFANSPREVLVALKKQYKNKGKLEDRYNTEASSFAHLLYNNGRTGITKNFK
jgi:enoyl-CoA hydratase/carnithine racemase